jgi:hypothetical protein
MVLFSSREIVSLIFLKKTCRASSLLYMYAKEVLAIFVNPVYLYCRRYFAPDKESGPTSLLDCTHVARDSL